MVILTVHIVQIISGGNANIQMAAWYNDCSNCEDDIRLVHKSSSRKGCSVTTFLMLEIIDYLALEIFLYGVSRIFTLNFAELYHVYL